METQKHALKMSKVTASHSFHRFLYEWRRRRQQGIRRLALGLSRRLLGMVLWVMLLPLSLVFHALSFRRVPVYVQRIGHLALEPDCLIKEQQLGLIKPRRWILLAPPGHVANQHLLRYWEPFFIVVKGRMLCFIIESMSRWLVMRQDASHYLHAFDHAHAIYRIYSQWGERPPLLHLSSDDQEDAPELLQSLGIPDDAWFVCVHNREPGFSLVDEELHAHRNGRIEALIPAIEEIVRAGGWVVRIGESSSQPLPEMPHVIDYAHHHMKSERLDIILCAKARFIIGNTSGISFVGTVFGVPNVLVNMIPVSTLGLSPHDISIPKLLWSEAEGRYLRFDEIMHSPVANYRYARLYQESGFRVDENSQEDILEVTQEMLGVLDGTFTPCERDKKLQKQYLGLFQPDHYSYLASSRIGSAFLRKHKSLLI